VDLYQSGPIYSLGNSDHIVLRGREFFQSQMTHCQVEDGTVDHAVWMEMLNNGAPVLMIKPAYDVDGRIIEDFSAVFIPVDIQREVEEEFEFVKTNEDWSHCKRDSDRHDPEKEVPILFG
jgi:hypothetical protein